MAEYYKNCTSSTTVNIDMEKEGHGEGSKADEMSEFDKHHETLLMDDAEEGWASELRHYLGTMQCDVGITRGNPGVFQLNPYPYPRNPYPCIRGKGLWGWGQGFLKPKGLSNYQGYLCNFL